MKKSGKKLRYIIPCILILGVIVSAVLHLRVRGLPKEGTVHDDVVALLKEAKSNQTMLTIHGDGAEYAYSWFYNKGSVTSTENTDLTVSAFDENLPEVKEALQCSLAFGFTLSDSFRMNGYPTLTLELEGWNCIDCRLYRYYEDKLVEFATPAVNSSNGIVSVTFTIPDMSASYYIAAGFADNGSQIAEGEEPSEEEIASNRQFLQMGKDEVEQENEEEIKEADTDQNVVSDPEHIEENEKPEEPAQKQIVSIGKKKQADTKTSVKSKTNKKQKKKKQKAGKSSGGISIENHNQENSGNEFQLSTELTYIKKNEKQPTKPAQQPANRPQPKKQPQTEQKPSAGPSKKKEYQGDKKPSSSASSLTNYGTARTYSDGTQKGKDQYETDPVPKGKPMPVEPQDMSIDYQKSHVCTLSVDVLTLLDSKNHVVSGKEKYVPKDGYLYTTQQVIFYEGESVYDVLKREMEKAGIQMEVSWTPGYNSVYVEGIHNLYEFDGGELSGWMYQVNGWYPNYGCSRYLLQEGDVIQWRYTCDLGRDVGCDWDLTK